MINTMWRKTKLIINYFNNNIQILKIIHIYFLLFTNYFQTIGNFLF